MKQLLLTLSMLAIIIVGCNHVEKIAEAGIPASETFNLNAAKETIAATNALFAEAISKSDSAGVANLYSSDAILMAPNMPSFKGTAGVTSFTSAGIRMGMKNFKLATTEVWGNNEMVSETGVYTLTDDKGATLDIGKYIVLWKNEGGKWKMFRDIFNSDMPPPPPPAKKK